MSRQNRLLRPFSAAGDIVISPAAEKGPFKGILGLAENLYACYNQTDIGAPASLRGWAGGVNALRPSIFDTHRQLWYNSKRGSSVFPPTPKRASTDHTSERSKSRLLIRVGVLSLKESVSPSVLRMGFCFYKTPQRERRRREHLCERISQPKSRPCSQSRVGIGMKDWRRHWKGWEESISKKKGGGMLYGRDHSRKNAKN